MTAENSGSYPSIGILSVLMDQKTQQRLNEWRKQYFPESINYLQAHITLFHKLDLHKFASMDQLPAQPKNKLELSFDKVYFLGKGFAIETLCPPLLEFHLKFQKVYFSELSKQDQQTKKLHVTLQNKVPPDKAKIDFEEFKAQFQGFKGEAIGLSLHHYLGGPWQKVKDFKF